MEKIQNGDAIYGTTSWSKFGEGKPSEFTQKRKTRDGISFNEAEQDFTSKDIRFTAKGDTLYATMLAWPEADDVTITTFARTGFKETDGYYLYPDEIESIIMLGDGKELAWKLELANGLTIKMPEEKPCDHAFVFKIVRKNQ